MLQMADRPFKCPRGVIESVLVKVEKFLFPTDFFILDMEEDENVLIILGRPFLDIGKAQINVQEDELKLRVQEDELTLRVQGDEVTFHVFQAMKHPYDEINDGIIESIHKESMSGDFANQQDKLSVIAKGIDGLGDNIFHPP